MRRVVIAGAEACKTAIGPWGGSTLLVTLTYRPGARWAAEHVSDYLRAVRKHCLDAKVRYRYQWVIELTKAGVPHYHVLFWVPHGVRLPMPDASGMWPHGMSQIARARNAVGYLVKYATKGSNDFYTLPRGARLFGVGGIGRGRDERLATHRAGIPMWLLERIGEDSSVRRVARVGWLDLSTGEVFRTPYTVRWWKDEWGIVVVQIVKEIRADEYQNSSA